MYRLAYSPLAQQDLVDLVRYVSVELNNQTAAQSLATKLVEAAESILDFPYASPVYMPARRLKQEYRKLLVDNYILFYSINESTQTVIIARALYARRRFEKLL